MQLLTKAIKAKLVEATANSLHGIQSPNTEFVCKFFDPCGSWTWYVLEGQEEEDGDWRFYGLVDGFEREWGYFMLSELESARGPLGIGIERDLHFEDVPVESVDPQAV